MVVAMEPPVAATLAAVTAVVETVVTATLAMATQETEILATVTPVTATLVMATLVTETRVMETRATETVAMATVVTARAETVMARPTHPAVLSQDKALRTVSKVRTVMDTLLTVNKAKTKATAIPLSNSKAKAVATALAKVTIMANTMAPEPTRPPSPNQAAPQAGTETVGESGPSDPSPRSDILHEQVELLFFTNI
jgi:hypothetical protein